ncbi:hypothetical protein FDECE_10580 [Fusarium decemcellulare]|nr:hypothetical protein FDECE_10580 [Fusarium decemcellulare]
MTLLLFYLDLSPQPWFRWSVYGTMFFLCGSQLGPPFASVFQCDPIAKGWNPTLAGQYINMASVYQATAITGVISDVFVITIPIPMVINPKIPKQQKAGLMLMFMVGTMYLAPKLIGERSTSSNTGISDNNNITIGGSGAAHKGLKRSKYSRFDDTFYGMETTVNVELGGIDKRKSQNPGWEPSEGGDAESQKNIVKEGESCRPRSRRAIQRSSTNSFRGRSSGQRHLRQDLGACVWGFNHNNQTEMGDKDKKAKPANIPLSVRAVCWFAGVPVDAVVKPRKSSKKSSKEKEKSTKEKSSEEGSEKGFTGRAATINAKDTIEYGTNVVGGVSPGKGGQTHLGLPVFNTVREAMDQVNPHVSAVFVPAQFAAKAIIESIEAEVPLVVSVAEHVPVHDMLRVHEILRTQSKTRLVGPNCPGIIAPEQCRVGIMPYKQYTRGCIGIVSKSGTLSYEAVGSTSRAGLGQSIVVGMGGDMLPGTTLADGLKLFFDHEETKGIIVIGEIGGQAELEAARLIQRNQRSANPKPVVAMVAGRTAPAGKTMGHAGAVFTAGGITAEAKAKALEEAGAVIVPHPGVMGETMKKLLGMYHATSNMIGLQASTCRSLRGLTSSNKLFATTQIRNLHLQEYQSQALLKDVSPSPRFRVTASLTLDSQADVRAPHAISAHTPDEGIAAIKELVQGGRAFIKPQVLGARRPKYLVNLPDVSLFDNAPQALGHFYVEKLLRPVKKWHFTMTIDRDNYTPVLRIRQEKGQRKEEPALEETLGFSLSAGISDKFVAHFFKKMCLPERTLEDLGKLLRGMFSIFSEKEAISLKTNVILTRNERLFCTDSRFFFDDAARGRQPELFSLRDSSLEVPEEVEAEKHGLVYVRMDGDIGNVVNGAGLAMATNDAISLYGGKSANFLDAGGQATKETMLQAFGIIMRDERVKAILVNIYGGITRCDMIAESIIAATKELGPLRVPMVVRLQGTNSEAGLKLLAEASSDIHVEADFGKAAERAVEMAKLSDVLSF